MLVSAVARESGSSAASDQREVCPPATFQQTVYNKLMLFQSTLPKRNCYTFTLSPTSNNLRIMLSSFTQLTKYIGRILNDQEIKSCFYTIEQSKHGKLHAHGILLTKSTFRYSGLNSLYKGVQLYVEPYKPDPTKGVMYHRESLPPTKVTQRTREQWVKYISKQPIAYVSFHNGKNFIKYTVCRGS